MKRLTLAVLSLSALLVLVSGAWQVAGATGDSGWLCAQMTPSRMLEDPGLAHEWAEALRSSRPTELERVKALLEQIRSAHGCDGEVAMPDRPLGLPPGHPPVRGRERWEPRLPPGHPPIPSAPGLQLGFDAPAIVTI